MGLDRSVSQLEECRRHAGVRHETLEGLDAWNVGRPRDLDERALGAPPLDGFVVGARQVHAA
jgi:hypothetical protein